MFSSRLKYTGSTVVCLKATFGVMCFTDSSPLADVIQALKDDYGSATFNPAVQHQSLSPRTRSLSVSAWPPYSLSLCYFIFSTGIISVIFVGIFYYSFILDLNIYLFMLFDKLLASLHPEVWQVCLNTQEPVCLQ